MATVTVASSNPGFPRTAPLFTLDDNLPGPVLQGRPREASFSSYLSAADESFSLRLSGEFVEHRSGRKKAEAQDFDELDVFGAEKYFNGGIDGEDVEIRSEKTWKQAASPLKEPVLEPVVLTAGRRAKLGTPSTCSEASGNSRSLLLRDAQRERYSNPPRSPHGGAVGKKFLGIFPCSCSDGVSVEVDRDKREGHDGGGGLITASRRLVPEHTPRQELWCNEEARWRRGVGAVVGAGLSTRREEYYFSFPPVHTAVGPKVVLGAPLLGKEELAGSLRRNMTTMSPFSSGAGGGRGGASARADDDACSDASSDLFEIESLSTGTIPLGGAGGTSASTTCYEPSEASIEWSVVTASAANFSLASDGEGSPPRGRRHDGRQQGQQRSGGLLLGCGSAKAVNVVPSTARRVPVPEIKAAEVGAARQQRQRHKSMDAAPAPAPEAIRYHGGSPRSVDFDYGHVLAPRGIPRPAAPHSPRLQLPLLS